MKEYIKTTVIGKDFQRSFSLKYTGLILLLMLVFVHIPKIYAQSDRGYGFFNSGDVVYTLGDQVNVRETPSVNGTLVTTLPLATKIFIIEKTEEPYSLRGFSADWYNVSFIKDGIEKSGYIWGGMMAGRCDTIDHSSGTYILYGVYSVDSVNGWPEIKMQARIVKNHTELSKVIFAAVGSFGTFNECEVLDNRGIKGINNVIFINFHDDFCAGAFGKQVFFWNGTELLNVKKLSEGADAPLYLTENFIFPNDKGGKPGFIKLHHEMGNWDDTKNKNVIEEEWTQIYTWDGKKLVLQK